MDIFLEGIRIEPECAILKIFEDHEYCFAKFIKIHILYKVLSNLVIRSYLGRGVLIGRWALI